VSWNSLSATKMAAGRGDAGHVDAGHSLVTVSPAGSGMCLQIGESGVGRSSPLRWVRSCT
jgi:hypothetical protein